MTITNYTKYMLEHGETLEVAIQAEKQSPAKLCAMQNCKAYYNQERGSWFVELTPNDWKEKCQVLRGFTAMYVIRKH